MRRNNNSKNRLTAVPDVGVEVTLSEKSLEGIRVLNAKAQALHNALGVQLAKFESDKATLLAAIKATSDEYTVGMKKAALKEHHIDLNAPDQKWSLNLKTGSLIRTA